MNHKQKKEDLEILYYSKHLIAAEVLPISLYCNAMGEILILKEP